VSGLELAFELLVFGFFCVVIGWTGCALLRDRQEWRDDDRRYADRSYRQHDDGSFSGPYKGVRFGRGPAPTSPPPPAPAPTEAGDVISPEGPTP
jgi:hypothetical protein